MAQMKEQMKTPEKELNEIEMQVQEPQSIPNKMDAKGPLQDI